MTTTDAIGQEHTDWCWQRAEGSLMDELVTQDLDLSVDYFENPTTGRVDYRIPAWELTQQEVVATWLSDGTVTCTCND